MSKLTRPDEFTILGATWILASNDENPLITYEGVRQRLNLEPDFDVRGLVRRHGELFRRGMPQQRLDDWKNRMRAGRAVPSWIREAPEIDRQGMIDALSPDDGFRSQFRSTSDAPKTEVPIIEWGLAHIERLRKARNEAREASAKSWQMWLVFATSVLGILATIATNYL